MAHLSISNKSSRQIPLSIGGEASASARACCLTAKGISSSRWATVPILETNKTCHTRTEKCIASMMTAASPRTIRLSIGLARCQASGPTVIAIRRGLAFSPVTGELWEAEHGPRGGDELNILHPGHNYGWPVITYGMNYDGTPITDHTAQEGMDQPITYWVPSIAASPIAFYTGNRFPQWKNNLFVGSLAAQELRRLVIDGHSVTHQEILFKGIGRVRDIVNAPDGYLYIVLNQPNRIERLVPAANQQ